MSLSTRTKSHNCWEPESRRPVVPDCTHSGTGILSWQEGMRRSNLLTWQDLQKTWESATYGSTRSGGAATHRSIGWKVAARTSDLFPTPPGAGVGGGRRSPHWIWDKPRGFFSGEAEMKASGLGASGHESGEGHPSKSHACWPLRPTHLPTQSVGNLAGQEDPFLRNLHTQEGSPQKTRTAGAPRERPGQPMVRTRVASPTQGLSYQPAFRFQPVSTFNSKPTNNPRP